jgi:hypothetical protein
MKASSSFEECTDAGGGQWVRSTCGYSDYFQLGIGLFSCGVLFSLFVLLVWWGEERERNSWRNPRTDNDCCMPSAANRAKENREATDDEIVANIFEKIAKI